MDTTSRTVSGAAFRTPSGAGQRGVRRYFSESDWGQHLLTGWLESILDAAGNCALNRALRPGQHAVHVLHVIQGPFQQIWHKSLPGRTLEKPGRLSHSPEVAGSNPAPATTYHTRACSTASPSFCPSGAFPVGALSRGSQPPSADRGLFTGRSCCYNALEGRHKAFCEVLPTTNRTW